MKQQNKKINGPTPQDSMKVTATLGVITGNGATTNEGLVRKMKYFLNPLLLKLESNGQQITPLCERAAMYQMWKIRSLSFKFQPLVNSSNVSGSLVMIDYDQQGTTAKPENLDTIKARRHREMPIGRYGSFKIPTRAMLGPKTGWWLMDTNEDADQAFGGAVNVWVYLRTKNLLNVGDSETKDYTGPLFLLEVQAHYDFTGYAPKPALALLQNESATTRPDEVKIKNDTEGHLVVQMADPQGLRGLSRAFQRSNGDEHDNQTFWAVSSEVIATVAPHLGAWGWLLAGGWLILKKIIGVSYNGTSDFLVYASIEDAQRNAPVKALVNQRDAVTVPPGDWRVQQLTTPNVNIFTQQPAFKTGNEPRRPLGDDPEHVLDITLKPTSGGWTKWNPSDIQDMRNGIIDVGPMEFKKYNLADAHSYRLSFPTDGGHGTALTLELPKPSGTKYYLFRSYGYVICRSSQDNNAGIVMSTSLDWTVSDLSSSSISISQIYKPSAGKVFKLEQKNTGDWIDWNANNDLVAALNARQDDEIHLLKLAFSDLTNTRAQQNKFPAYGFFNKRNGKFAVFLVYVDKTNEQIQPHNFTFQIIGTSTQTGLIQNLNFPIRNGWSCDDEENCDADDEDEIMSSVSAMYQKLDLEEVENEKEYWRKTAQALMAEKVSRMNHFHQSSSGL